MRWNGPGRGNQPGLTFHNHDDCSTRLREANPSATWKPPSAPSHCPTPPLQSSCRGDVSIKETLTSRSPAQRSNPLYFPRSQTRSLIAFPGICYATVPTLEHQCCRALVLHNLISVSSDGFQRMHLYLMIGDAASYNGPHTPIAHYDLFRDPRCLTRQQYLSTSVAFLEVC